MQIAEIYIPDSVTHAPDPGTRPDTDNRGGKGVVNVQKAGEVYRCNVCGNVVFVKEAGGGELVCHGEPMQLVETQESKTQ